MILTIAIGGSNADQKLGRKIRQEQKSGYAGRNTGGAAVGRISANAT
jgi:hypothetical protein